MTYPIPRGTLTENRPLADLTWLRVGGPADALFQPADPEDLSAFLRDLDPAVPHFPATAPDANAASFGREADTASGDWPIPWGRSTRSVAACPSRTRSVLWHRP